MLNNQSRQDFVLYFTRPFLDRPMDEIIFSLTNGKGKDIVTITRAGKVTVNEDFTPEELNEALLKCM